MCVHVCLKDIINLSSFFPALFGKEFLHYSTQEGSLRSKGARYLPRNIQGVGCPSTVCRHTLERDIDRMRFQRRISFRTFLSRREKWGSLKLQVQDNIIRFFVMCWYKLFIINQVESTYSEFEKIG